MARNLLNSLNSLKQAATLIGRPVSRLAPVRALSMLVVAGGLLGAAPHPAAAGPATAPIFVDFSSLHCFDQSDDAFIGSGSDEPYVVFFSANIHGTAQSVVKRTSVFDDVDSGETRSQLVHLWGLFGSGAPIAAPGDVIFLAAVMENDSSSNAIAVRAQVDAFVRPKLAAYKAAGLSRSIMVSNLKADMDLAISASKGSDDRISTTRELALTTLDIDRARDGLTTNKSLDYFGSDSHYRTYFKVY